MHPAFEEFTQLLEQIDESREDEIVAAAADRDTDSSAPLRDSEAFETLPSPVRERFLAIERARLKILQWTESNQQKADPPFNEKDDAESRERPVFDRTAREFLDVFATHQMPALKSLLPSLLRSVDGTGHDKLTPTMREQVNKGFITYYLTADWADPFEFNHVQNSRPIDEREHLESGAECAEVYNSHETNLMRGVYQECFFEMVKQGKWGHAWQILDYNGEYLFDELHRLSDQERERLALECVRRDETFGLAYVSRYQRLKMLRLLNGQVSPSRDEYERTIKERSRDGNKTKKTIDRRMLN